MSDTLRYVGYHDKLPVKAGDIVTIRKGTPILYRGKHKLARRTYRVKVNHTLPGRSIGHLTDPTIPWGTFVPQDSPSVRWPGPGGYWNEVDINLIPEAFAEDVIG